LTDVVRFEQSRGVFLTAFSEGPLDPMGRANDRIGGMNIQFIAGVMDWLIAGVINWLEDRHCAECGQYIGDDRECQSAVCVLRGAVSARGTMTSLRPNAAAWGRPGRASGA
jgi:hypothetical protein